MRNFTRFTTVCFVLAFLLAMAASTTLAEIKLPAIVGDHMVLQRNRPVPLWGWDKPGDEVTVAIAGQTAKAKANDKGRWQVELAPMEAGGPFELVISNSAGDKKTIKDVLVGEVWVCSGQSNMAMTVGRCNNANEEIKNANHPKLRMFMVQREVAFAPKDNCTGDWTVCSPDTVGGYTAAGYFFGRDLLKDLKVPIGLINTSWGGTPSEAWTSRKALESKPSLKPLLDRWDKMAKAGGKAKNNPHRPANLFNGMIAPIVPYGIQGAIWYQGESNVSRAYQYRTIFPTMIENWRQIWGQGEFPFGFVQLAPFRYGKADPACCAELWEAQLLTLKNYPNIGMAVITDIGNIKDIHPKNKQDVGARLALWAKAKVYGKRDVVYSGPIYESMTIEGNKIRLRFDHVDGGLSTRDGKAPSHFTIAGDDKKFHPAEAKIDGDTIVVQSPAVAKPVAARFAWRDDAEPNLTNKSGLPASPFRTDKWKGLTVGMD
ncbi:MAG: sialate O-acetylesterase [Pirellulales bacterium]|nr:sialate O-acetylesterase [Pirellulales bacterium]